MPLLLSSHFRYIEQLQTLGNNKNGLRNERSVGI
jgi:hypothetical protein